MLLFQQLLLTLLLYVSPHHGIADANKDGHDILEKKGHDGGLLATTPNDKDSLAIAYLRVKELAAESTNKALSLKEKRQVLEELQLSASERLIDLDGVRDEVSQLEGLQWMASLDDSFLVEALRSMSDIILLFKDMEAKEEQERAEDIVSVHNVTRKRRHLKDNEDWAGANQKNDYHSLHRSLAAKKSKQFLNAPVASRFYSRHLEIQQGLAGGNPPLSNAGPLREAHHSKRNLWELRRRLIGSTKETQCKLLVECVRGMSLFDFFVYIHSDDIDNTAGTVDENLVVFDEGDFIDEFDAIQVIADALASSIDDAKCNSLLQKFHRTIEAGSVPQWRPATISQVCLAEGTTTYVKLAELTKVFTIQLEHKKSNLVIYQGNWGGWKDWKVSPSSRFYACGANLRFEDSQGGGDDTAANGLKLKYCDLSNWSNSQKEVEVWGGNWGAWKGMKMCPANQFIAGAQVRYEDSQGGGDDTALNGLKIYCAPKNTNTGGLWVTVFGGVWGGWKPEKKRTDQNMLVTGARVQFEDSQGGGDDTAMNGLELKFETTADDFWERQQSTVENIVPIPFQCAEELFYSDDRLVNHKAESFVFQGCSSGGSRRALSPGGTGWEQIPGGLKHVSPGDADTVWGVNAADIIYRKLGSKNWENIPGKLNQINTAADGTVWGTTKAIFEEADWTMYQGNWGGWQPWKTSDLNYYACGANLRFEDSQGGGDDTAANGLKLKYCLISNWNSQKEVEVYPGIWGSWKGMKMCPANQFIVGAQVRYEDSQGGGDDTALNGLKIYCAPKNTNTGGLWVTVYGGIWGGWKPAKIRTNQNMLVTGARVQFEGSQGGGDDTAMNGIQFKYKSTADTGRDIYRLKLESNSWEKIGGKLKHVSVGSANTVWGVNINDDIYRWNGSGWVYIGGKLKQISVAADGTVWGVNSADTIYRRTGSNTWENIPGKLKYVSVGDANTVWGVNANDYIYRWTGSGWENIAGGLKQIEVAADGTVWGVNSGDAIYRRTGLDIKLSLKAADCPLTGYRFPVLDSNSQLRDVHGQLTTMQGAFGFTNLGGLETDFKSCQNEARQEYDKPDSDMSLDDLTKAYNECLREKLYEPIDTSLELVFGSKPSIGFICGIKDAVRQYSKNDGKALPGHCCLDAPFQLDDQHWGYEYDCSSNSCKAYGPYFAGVSEDACLAQGGTYCKNPTDCSVLKTCIGEMIAGKKGREKGKKEKKEEKKKRKGNQTVTAEHIGEAGSSEGFKAYLNNAPNIEDSSDPTQCGNLRKYFGFDENYIYDSGICMDIDQLKSTPDFRFLDTFFNQGSGGGSGSQETPPVQVTMPPFVLEKIDRSSSEADSVLAGDAWASTNFALEQALDTIKDVMDTLMGFECPEDLTGAVKTACAITKNVGILVIQIICIILRIFLNISEFTRENESEVNNIQPIEMWEDTQAIYKHMLATGKYIQDGFDKVLAETFKIQGGRRERLLLEGTKGKDGLTLDFDSDVMNSLVHYNEVRLNDVEAKLDKNNDVNLDKLNDVEAKLDRLKDVEAKLDRLNDVEAKLDKISKDSHLYLAVEIVKKQTPTTLLVLTTLRGVPVDVDVEVMAYDANNIGGESPVAFERRVLSGGKAIITLKEEVQAGLVFVKAMYYNGRENQDNQESLLSVESTSLLSLK